MLSNWLLYSIYFNEQQRKRSAMSSRKGGGAGKAGPAHKNKFAFKHNPKSVKTKEILSIPNVGLCAHCTGVIEWRKSFRYVFCTHYLPCGSAFVHSSLFAPQKIQAIETTCEVVCIYSAPLLDFVFCFHGQLDGWVVRWVDRFVIEFLHRFDMVCDVWCLVFLPSHAVP